MGGISLQSPAVEMGCLDLQPGLGAFPTLPDDVVYQIIQNVQLHWRHREHNSVAQQLVQSHGIIGIRQ